MVITNLHEHSLVNVYKQRPVRVDMRGLAQPPEGKDG